VIFCLPVKKACLLLCCAGVAESLCSWYENGVSYAVFGRLEENRGMSKSRTDKNEFRQEKKAGRSTVSYTAIVVDRLDKSRACWLLQRVEIRDLRTRQELSDFAEFPG
jgi:hypothetical protein